MQWNKMYAVYYNKRRIVCICCFFRLGSLLVPSTTCKIRVFVVSLLLPLVVTRSSSQSAMLWKLLILGVVVIVAASTDNRSQRAQRDVDASICDFKAGAKELVNGIINQGVEAEEQNVNIEFDRFLCKVGITKNEFYLILAGVCAAILLCCCIKKCLCC